MHFKSPSLGSNSSLMVKVYNNSIAPKPSATTNTTNTSFRGPSTVHSPKASIASSPKASFRECISAKKDKKKLVFADIFPSTTKTSQTPSILEESPVKIFVNDSFSTTSGTLSPTTPHLGSYRMYITGRSKIGEKPGLKIVASDNNKNSVNSVTRQVMSPKENEVNWETGRVEMIKHKEMEVRKVKEQAAKELKKKELVAEIYERLVEMCKKNNSEGKNNSSYINNNSILKDGNRTQSELDIIVENESQGGGSVNRIKSTTNRKKFAINNSSLYNILTHKSMHTPTSKQSFFERIDARLNLEKDDSTPNNREEAGRRSITMFKQNVIKVKNDGQSPKSPQYRVKTVLPGSRMKKIDKKVQEKSGARSEPPNESTFHSFGKRKRIIRLGESATMYTGEGSEDQNLLSIQTTTLNSKLIKENSGNHSFSMLVDRLDNVFSKYHNENTQLLAKIQELDQKIRTIEATKQRRAEHP